MRDADARLVRAELARVDELHRVGGHDRQLEPACQRTGLAHVVPGLRLTGALKLNVVGIEKPVRPLLRQPVRRVGIAVEQRLPDVARHCAGERDQALGRAGAGEPVAPDLGAATKLVRQVGAGQQLAQTTVAGTVLHQQQRTKRLVALGRILDPHIAADHRLHPCTARRLVELDHPEQVGQIGQRERWLAVLRRMRHRIVDARNAIDDRVFAVETQMDEGRRSRRIHGGDFTAPAPARPCAGEPPQRSRSSATIWKPAWILGFRAPPDTRHRFAK